MIIRKLVAYCFDNQVTISVIFEAINIKYLLVVILLKRVSFGQFFGQDKVNSAFGTLGIDFALIILTFHDSDNQ